MRRVFSLVLPLLAIGCARQPVTDFADRGPAFHVEDFYSGHLKGYGFFFSRSGNVVKQFSADEDGHWDGTTLALHEHYLFSDGKTQDRDWTFTKAADGSWIGRTPEVVGVTTGWNPAMRIGCITPSIWRKAAATTRWISMTGSGWWRRRS